MAGVKYKIDVLNRYDSWNIHDMSDEYYNIVNLNIDPINEKLFTYDVFYYDGKNVQIEFSVVRNSKNIPGVLSLGKTTFGKIDKKGTNKKYYKCYPDESKLPIFLVPYEVKTSSFSKVVSNKFVTFEFIDWEGKHPVGRLTNVIGDVKELPNFYEYQLYCKSLHFSISKFKTDAKKKINGFPNNDSIYKYIKENYANIEDWANKTNIYSIDPQGSLDYDDAYSFDINSSNANCYELNIYISNVTIILDALNLWDSFSNRVSTIYLPDMKRPMIPSVLSENICSLMEGQTNVVLACVFNICNDEIQNVEFKNCLIKVKKNYVYDTEELLESDHYKNMLPYIKNLNKRYKYLKNIQSSHDLIAYFMILMNYHSAKELIKHKSGIYRMVTIQHSEEIIPTNLPDNVFNFIKLWKGASGSYTFYSDILEHEVLQLENYVHITSPIRRLVDLLNIIQLQQNMQAAVLSESSNNFLQYWFGRLEYINTTMRSIRKLQNDCNVLQMCCEDSGLLDKDFKGYLFDRLERSDGMYQYVVYLYDLKIVSRINLNIKIENYTNCIFKLYIFNNESRFKKKIRLKFMNIY